jgi:RNA polymerase sigma factor for flagellar operon FliA
MARWAVADKAFTEQFSAWRTDHDPAARETIVLHYFPLCTVVAQGIARRLPPHIDVEELTSLAVMGLMRAVDRYDPALGNSFWKYAVLVMKSSVLDGIRAEDWAPRSLRKRQKALETAESELAKSFGRDPTEAEIAIRTGWTPAQIRSTRMEISASWHTCLDDEATVFEVVCADRQAWVETEHFREAVAAAVSGLDDPDQVVVCLRYYEQMTTAEIALKLGITKAEVEAAHNRAVSAVWHRVREVAAV